MSLTAEEWLALPIEEGDRRADELSPHEAFRLRTTLSYWPRGPEHYPDGPHILPKLTEEEKEKNARGTFNFLKSNGWYPEELTFKEWAEAGMPLDWEKGK